MVTTKAPSSLPVMLCKRAILSTLTFAIIIYVRELVVAKEVELQFVPGEMNPADMFTKKLQKIKFTQLQNQLGLEFGAKCPWVTHLDACTD